MMKWCMTFMLIIIGICLLTVECLAKDEERQQNNIPMTTSTGDIEAALIITDEPDQLFEDWENPSEGVPVKIAKEVKKGTPFMIIVAFAGCQANEKGHCHATVDFTVSQPDGSVYGEIKEAELWVNGPSPPKGTIELSVGYLTIILESHDPYGKYTVNALIRDHNANIDLPLVEKFVAVK